MHDTMFRKAFLLLMVVGVTVTMIVVLQPFIMTLLVAAVMAGLIRPVFVWITGRVGGRKPLAAGLTVVITLIGVIGPLLTIGGLVVSQAASITENVRPIVERSINSPSYLVQRLPGYETYLKPYRRAILTKASEVVNSLGSFLVSSLSNTTLSTVSFILNFFLALYTMFFFLLDGPELWKAAFEHLPLHIDERELLTQRFLSITRATIKGTIVIGVVQGTLAGAAFWAVGIPNAAFWGVLMTVMAILPLIGSGLIWLPACIILFATGAVGEAIGLLVFCVLVVSSVDNVLRPWLVGRDTKMHDLVILFSTLGGIMVFGATGFIIGPVLAGIFVTTWHIFGSAYRDQLADGTPRILTASGKVAEDETLSS